MADAPIACEIVRRRHGKAIDERSSSKDSRVASLGSGSPSSVDSRRTARPAASVTRAASRGCSPANSSLTAGREKNRFGPSSTRSSTSSTSRPRRPTFGGMRVSILTAMPDPAALSRIVEPRLPRFLTELEQLVNIDCGSYTPEGVNRVADFVTEALQSLGATVERTQHAPAADQSAAR